MSWHWCSRTSGVAVMRLSVRTVRDTTARQCPCQEAEGWSLGLLMHR